MEYTAHDFIWMPSTLVLWTSYVVFFSHRAWHRLMALVPIYNIFALSRNWWSWMKMQRCFWEVHLAFTMWMMPRWYIKSSSFLLLVIVILDASSYVAFYQLIVDLFALVNSCLHVCLQGNMLRIFTRGGITQRHCIDTEVVTVLQVNFALTKLQFQYCRSSP